MSIRVLIADDHRMFADGLSALLSQECGLEVVGRARDGRQAVSLALELVPDVVVMDISMPGLSGIEAARRLTAERSATKVLCLSMHCERQYLSAALEAGAVGYVLKNHASDKLITAIRSVSTGGFYFCPDKAAIAAQEYRSTLMSGTGPGTGALTEREREVLQLVAEGYTSREIAARLFVSIRTVASHRHHLTEKLDIHSVAGLTKYAIRHGLTTAECNQGGSRSA